MHKKKLTLILLHLQTALIFTLQQNKGQHFTRLFLCGNGQSIVCLQKKSICRNVLFGFFLNVTPFIFSSEATMFPQLSAETLRKGRWRGCARQTLAVAQRQPAFLLQECHYDSGLIYLPIFTRTFFFVLTSHRQII